MIKIAIDIDYSSAKPMTAAEKERLAEAIRRVLQPTLAQACCSVRRDPEPGTEPHDAEFFNSIRLDITPTIEVL